MALRTIKAGERETILEALFRRTNHQRQHHEQPGRWHRIEAILEDGRVTPRATAGSLWGIYNAVTRDEDYRQSREAGGEARLERVWFGSGAELKVRTLNICSDFLKAAA